MAPWFLVNAFGIFPLVPVIVSSYMECKLFSTHLFQKHTVMLLIKKNFTDSTLRNKKTQFKILWEIVNVLLNFEAANSS